MNQQDKICSISEVDVARWDGYYDNKPPMTHKIAIDDQRSSNGQVYIDISSLETRDSGQPICPAITVEVANLNRMLAKAKIGLQRDIDVPAVHLHFDNSDLAASFFHEPLGNGMSRFLMRLEADVSLKRIQDGLYEVVLDI